MFRLARTLYFTESSLSLRFLPSSSSLSFFSRFRPKRFTEQKNEQKAENKVEDEGSKLWIDAVKEFEEHRSLSLQQTAGALSRTQSRRLKKRAFLYAIRVYLERYGKTRRGFNQFASNALNRMEEFEVADDLECYKAILQVFPTGRMVATNFLQAEWSHFPRQQDTVIALLQQMRKHYVIPDDQVGQQIIDIFGWRCHAMTHYRHLMYWVPKLANANPWPVAPHILDDLDEDPLHLTRLIMERICADPMADLRVIKLTESSDPSASQPSSMISAQTPEQKALLSYAVGRTESSTSRKPVIFLDGPHFVWYQRLQAAYYTLWTELDKTRLEKETERATIREQSAAKPDLSKLPVFGHLESRFDSQLDRVRTSTTASTQLQIHRDPTSVPLVSETNHALLNRPSTQMSRVQPEYDNRWMALRQTHAYTFLPGQLTTHEQAEGTILALGVVTPHADALVNQRQLFTHIVSEGTKLSDHTPTAQSANIAPVPSGAPASLIRAWLKDLQIQNPCLENSTLVIRVPLLDDATADREPSSADPIREFASAKF